MSSFKLAYTGT